MDEELIELYDRFSFDKLFRILLAEEFDTEEALNFILNCCELSPLVYQERIENEYYMKISPSETLSDDLRISYEKIIKQIIQCRN